jgi:hypothetical protein
MSRRIARYKPVGWRNEPYRHYLASKGISTRHRYFVRDELKGNRGFSGLHSAFSKGHSVMDLKEDERLRSEFNVSLQDIAAFEAQGSKSSKPEGLSVAEGDVPQQAVPVIEEPAFEQPVQEESVPDSQGVEAPGNVVMTPGVPSRAPLQFSSGFSNE